jgi:hypothetical protein
MITTIHKLENKTWIDKLGQNVINVNNSKQNNFVQLIVNYTYEFKDQSHSNNKETWNFDLFFDNIH